MCGRLHILPITRDHCGERLHGICPHTAWYRHPINYRGIDSVWPLRGQPPNIPRRRITLMMCTSKDDVIDVDDDNLENNLNNVGVVHYASAIDEDGNYAARATLGRCNHSGITHTYMSREICDIIFERSHHDQPAQGFLVMKKAPNYHNVHLNGRRVNTPVGVRVPILDGAIVSLHGPITFAYEVRILQRIIPKPTPPLLPQTSLPKTTIHVLQRQYEMCLEGNLTDMTVRCPVRDSTTGETEDFLVHSVIAISQSDHYFPAVTSFQDNARGALPEESDASGVHQRVVVVDIAADIFKSIRQYMYTWECPIYNENVHELMCAAHLIGIKSLFKDTVHFIAREPLHPDADEICTKFSVDIPSEISNYIHSYREWSRQQV